MIFTLEPLPAKEGDCLLLHWGKKNDPRLAVIDGGPGRVFEENLKPRLEDIIVNRGIGRLTLELVMISHMDSDHIVGVKKLLRGLKREVESNAPVNERPFVLKRLWHNVFNDVIGDSIDQYYQTLTASYQASIGGNPNPTITKALAKYLKKRKKMSAKFADNTAWDISLILAGHGEGREVRDDHNFLFQQGQTSNLNSPFKGNSGNSTLITSERTPKAISIGDLKIKVLGPMQAEIDALQAEFDSYIKKEGLSVEAVLAAYADESVKNLSSIVCLITFDRKKILLTGDARGDKIIDGLKKAKLLKQGKFAVDVLKVPHHGSDRNVEPDFFNTIKARTYVLSGDGKHGNPERDTIQWIVDSRKKTDKFDIVLTYPIVATDKLRKLEHNKRNKGPKKWNQKKHSLAALIADYKNQGYKFTVQAGNGWKIDLGAEKVTW